MKRLLLRFCRYCLKREIDNSDKLIKRLQSYAYPHAPELKADGTDQTYNLQYRLDVGVNYIPAGTFPITSTIVISDNTKLKDESD